MPTARSQYAYSSSLLEGEGEREGEVAGDVGEVAGDEGAVVGEGPGVDGIGSAEVGDVLEEVRSRASGSSAPPQAVALIATSSAMAVAVPPEPMPMF
ncbi:hypothetical protein [Knoellia locipacati]|uniref:hypothetical protein n=1 Tax=Knoellia locipacati TaxID=882824 RepID=UPI00164B9F33|nr:hypothetical protein [Knoellia locipacati]